MKNNDENNIYVWPRLFDNAPFFIDEFFPGIASLRYSGAVVAFLAAGILRSRTASVQTCWAFLQTQCASVRTRPQNVEHKEYSGGLLALSARLLCLKWHIKEYFWL